MSYSTLLDGEGDDFGYGLVNNSLGEVFVVGATDSSDFPTHSYQDDNAGGYDGFVTKIADDVNAPDVDPEYPHDSVLNSGTWIDLGVTDDYSGIYRV